MMISILRVGSLVFWIVCWWVWSLNSLMDIRPAIFFLFAAWLADKELRRRQDRAAEERMFEQYVSDIPSSVPDGKRLVHNINWTGQKLNERGFRAGFEEPDDERQ